MHHHHERFPDLVVDMDAELAELKPLRDILVDAGCIQDTVSVINKALAEGKRVLAEGANALMLDVDYGTYPYVTSSSTGIGGVLTGLGIPPKTIRNIYGVVKAYTTRVGEGPFPTEQLNSVGETLQDVG